MDWMNDFVLHARLAVRNAENHGNPKSLGPLQSQDVTSVSQPDTHYQLAVQLARENLSCCIDERLKSVRLSKRFKEEHFDLIVLQRN